MIEDVDQGQIMTFADKPERRLSSNVASMVHEIPEMGTSEMSDAENVQNGGMSRRVSEVHDLLQKMQILPQAASVTFEARLAEENDWTLSRAENTMREYRRFLLMAWVSSDMVVPSKDVDQAWHMHLTHSRHYWNVLCGTILQRPFHHEPSLGGASEDDRHEAAYARTLRLYEHLFGEAAPGDAWPRGCYCGTPMTPAPRHAAVVLASSPTVPMILTTAVTTAIAWGTGHPVWAGLLCVSLLLVTWMASASHRREQVSIAEAAEESYQRRMQQEAVRASYRVEPDLTEMKRRIEKDRIGTIGRAASERPKANTYRSPQNARSARVSESAMSSSGSEASQSFLAILALDPGHSSGDGGSHSSHGSHDSTSHSSHSCGSSSSHSCGSGSSSCGSSCGGSSCGGGGCGGSS